ncbi:MULTISPECIES: hypothetical protein [unclassified Streptosporangium]|uniref:hypothetical protein n=1 Tax=unclassified Streptosporangium TaxID=2632669 RepID=UPI002E2C6C4F|nr:MULTISPECIES: hypothetical protein [unclassified Streptosporangium]
MVRAYPFSWDFGFIWPPETEESEENLTYARAVLEACLPPVALASPEPPEQPIVYEYRDDDRPEWLGIRTILRERMPYARHVTAERMADAKAECARRSIDTTDFEEIWTRRVIAWIAEQTLYWCGLMVDDEKALTPWLMDLAELYVRRGMAGEKGVGALCRTKAVPESRAALARLATHEGLPDEIRELILYELRSCPDRR